MLPDRVSNPGPLTYESGALTIALRGPAMDMRNPLYTELCCSLLAYFFFKYFLCEAHRCFISLKLAVRGW